MSKLKEKNAYVYDPEESAIQNFEDLLDHHNLSQMLPFPGYDKVSLWKFQELMDLFDAYDWTYEYEVAIHLLHNNYEDIDHMWRILNTYHSAMILKEEVEGEEEEIGTTGFYVSFNASVEWDWKREEYFLKSIPYIHWRDGRGWPSEAIQMATELAAEAMYDFLRGFKLSDEEFEENVEAEWYHYADSFSWEREFGFRDSYWEKKDIEDFIKKHSDTYDPDREEKAFQEAQLQDLVKGVKELISLYHFKAHYAHRTEI